MHHAHDSEALVLRDSEAPTKALTATWVCWQVAADAGDEDAMYCLACLMQGHRGSLGEAGSSQLPSTSMQYTQPAPLPAGGDAEQLFWKAAEKGAPAHCWQSCMSCQA